MTLADEKIAEIAHELRAPLGGIRAMAELLMATGLDPAQRRLVTGLLAAGDHLNQVASDILDGAALDADALRLNIRKIALRPLLDAIATAATSRAQVLGLRFELTIAGDVPTMVACDGRRLRQMLENLLDNAFKFTPAGGVSLHVDRQAGDEAAYVRFSVEDDGPGFDQTKADVLFSRFATLDSGHRGTGLGLHLVGRLAAAMGGRATAENLRDPSQAAEGRGGARFSVLLPLHDAVPAVAPASTGSARRPRVLVVDDNEASRLVLSTIVEHIGCEPVLAHSGERAIEIVAAGGIDAVAMDLTLAGIDGIAATRAIRAMPAGLAIRIVAVTGRVSEEDRNAFAAAGADAFVPKPVSPRALMNALLELGVLPSNGQAAA